MAGAVVGSSTSSEPTFSRPPSPLAEVRRRTWQGAWDWGAACVRVQHGADTAQWGLRCVGVQHE